MLAVAFIWLQHPDDLIWEVQPMSPGFGVQSHPLPVPVAVLPLTPVIPLLAAIVALAAPPEPLAFVTVLRHAAPPVTAPNAPRPRANVLMPPPTLPLRSEGIIELALPSRNATRMTSLLSAKGSALARSAPGLYRSVARRGRAGLACIAK